MSAYNFRLAQNNGMSEEDEPHYRNLDVKINLICQTLYSASMDEQHWKWVAKTKSITNVSMKIRTITMTLLLLVKAFCHGWNSLKQEAA
jgi:hypothetical protein